MTAPNGYTPTLPPPAPTPGRVGQGTSIEQARAIGQVYAAVQSAKQWPRDVYQATKDMEDACRRKALADRAFYAFPRGDSRVSGASVYLARTLATCWGSVDFGIVELRQDRDYGESEMLAFAWDMQRNVRSSSIFVVPHRRDKKINGVMTAVPFAEMREVYDNNANNGARRLREAIFSILPGWYVDDAKDLCAKTVREGDGTPLPQRIRDTIDWFGGRLGVSVGQLEERIGRPNSRWSEFDVANLGVIWHSINRGELRAEDEFPAERVTVEEIVGNGQPPPVAAPAQSPPVQSPDDPPITDDRRLQLHEAFRGFGIQDRDERLSIASRLLRRQVPKFSDLRRSEAERLNHEFDSIREKGWTLTQHMAHVMGLEEGGA